MVRPRSAIVLTFTLALALASPAAITACARQEPPASATDPAKAGVDPSHPASSALPAVSADPMGEGGENRAQRRPRKPFTIHSSCPDIATVAFGEDPKAAATGKRTVASESSIDGPRDTDGNQTVWLLDAKGEPLVKVHISKGMKELEIGRSCRTLDAH